MSTYNIVLLDNFDSFTYNLVDELRAMGMQLTVYRNSVSADKVLQFMQSQGKDTLLLLSPGPGNPDSAGCMLELLNKVQGKFPVLGICLGHQAITQHYGGTIGRAPVAVHGKSSPVKHCGDKMFSNLPNPFPVARYHSLMATTMPDNLQVIAEYDGIPMAVYHEQDNMLGFQFHPESILTAMGSQLLHQSIEYLTRRAL
ncbi:aminodeoxychorismate/anthranilate synthase component II [Paraneptunicella aestuarii]|uniref:aminodeoxychorismate/anthranilate synthase component II n=1 Tax=Paraneptunicella aestuarii TaxID=2831148 RepID=UPI001E438A10|nr:aminodeoxychorismate/anthranilate synthase component II [Paraneptunicella aestuarii]UAA37347.1 aminodeoxychorismate/anthranilate synthase component II [Paraneptunicella aestuarii]